MLQKKFYIAGVQFHELHTVIKTLEDGTELELIPEPTNQYDPNAIRIEFKEVMLGYVPKRFSAEISAWMEMAQTVECKVSKLNPMAKPWEQCEVELTARTEDETDENSPLR